MKEAIRLLMEETNCDQGEAELALELAEDDLEKAIKTIGNLLKQIYAVKARVFFPERNLYGLFLVILNTRVQSIVRFHLVVSYNPSLYETLPSMDWYAFEKLIFYYRLDEGSLPDFTQELERKLADYITANISTFLSKEEASMVNVLRGYLQQEKIEVQIMGEELYLAQFQQLPEFMSGSQDSLPVLPEEHHVVQLDVTLFEEAEGKEIEVLSEGDTVMTQIADERDIAHYLAHLIGGRRGNEMVPLPATIKKILFEGEQAEAQLQYAPGITGLARGHKGMKVKILETKNEPWWKKLLSWT